MLSMLRKKWNCIEHKTDFISGNFESIAVTITKDNKKYSILNIYRPPQGDLKVFLNLFQTNYSKFDKCVVCGDMNIDLITPSNAERAYRDVLARLSLVPKINTATRVTQNTASCIDHILYLTHANETSGTMTCEVADHEGVFYIINPSNTKTKHKKITKQYYNYAKHNIQKIKDKLREYNWYLYFRDKLNNKENIEKMCKNFQNIIHEVFNNTCKKTMNIKKENNKWYSANLDKKRKNLHKLYKKFRNNRNNTNEYNYKSAKRIYEREIKMAKSNYYKNEIFKNNKNGKKLWQLLDEVTERKSKGDSSGNITLKINNTHVSESKSVADAFNHYFNNIGYNLGESIQGPLQEEIPQRAPDMKLHCTTAIEIIEILHTLKPKTSTGSDCVTSKLLKLVKYEIAIPLKILINACIKANYFPKIWKIAKIIPLYKAKDPTEMTNYRPISLLPAMSKIYEKVLHARIVEHMNRYGLFYNRQFGFRQKHGTTHALYKLHNDILINKKARKGTKAVFCDLSKAFDVLNHKVLYHKLETYGITGCCHAIITSYLHNRVQKVVVNEIGSEIVDQKRIGVPQGSVLGPLLFLIYINDIPSAVQDCDTILFADDTVFYTTKEDQVLNNDLERAKVWFKKNRLILNPGKTQLIHFCKNTDVNVEIDNVKITQSRNDEAVKYLGVEFDSSLKFKQQIRKIEKKINQSGAFIARARKYIHKKDLRLLFNALINPTVTYGILNWSNNITQKDLNILNKAYKRTIRYSVNAKRNAHCEPICKKEKILKLESIPIKEQVGYMANLIMTALPNIIRSEFRWNERHLRRGVKKLESIHGMGTLSNKFAGVWNENRELWDLKPKKAKKQLAENIISSYEEQCTIPRCFVCRRN